MFLEVETPNTQFPVVNTSAQFNEMNQRNAEKREGLLNTRVAFVVLAPIGVAAVASFLLLR